MAVKQPKPTSELKEGVDYDSLGLGGEFEEGRNQLVPRGSMQIIRFRIDTKTRYYNKQKKEGGILKFDGFDIATGEPVKYRHVGKTLIQQFNNTLTKVKGYEQIDEKGHVWTVFKTPVNIGGFEAVEVIRPADAPEGVQFNPYLKIKSTFID